jgi:peptidyl-prolyl cis-trans isomerase B (cyclophilin B)
MNLSRFFLTAIAAASIALLGAWVPAGAAQGHKGNPIVVMLVEHQGKPLGKIVIELYPKDAPISVANFIKLVNKKFYDGLTFHRVENLEGDTGKIVQGGDPNGNGSGNPGWSIKGEFTANHVNNPLIHNAGAFAMARTSDFNSAGCQFYICVNPVHALDGQYAVFGQVIQGLKIADQIVVGDKMTSVKLAE